jgi:signal transduction histidine kinase
VTLVVVAILCCLTGILAGTYSILTSEPLFSVILPYSFAVVVGLAVLVRWLTKRYHVLLYTFLVMILAVPVLFQCGVGGFTGDPGTVTIILWALLAPIGALMFQNTKAAVWWFLAYLALVVTALLLDRHFTHLLVTTTHRKLIFEQAQNIIALSITLFLSMLYFVRAFQREHSRAEKLVVDLTETNNSLETALRNLKEAQAELVQSEKMSSLGRLAAGIAHEINNPLGALKGTTDNSIRCISKIEQFLEQNEEHAGLREDASFRKYFRILKDNSQLVMTASARVSDTVGNFIDFARLDGAEFDRVNINDCIDTTLAVLQPQFADATRIVKEYADVPPLACYPSEVNQVLMNLLTHRIGALMGKGTITIRTFVRNKTVNVQIADDGGGMTEAEKAQLFEPEFSRDESRIRARLGLFASYNIVQKHKGRIEVEAVMGKGSRFTVSLPMDLDKTMDRR